MSHQGPRRDPAERLAAIHAQLTRAVEDLARSEAWREMLAVAARFPTYSPSNLIGEVRQVGEDLVSTHAVGDHRDDRGCWDPEPAQARHPAHLRRINGDPLEGHEPRLRLAADPAWRDEQTGP